MLNCLIGDGDLIGYSGRATQPTNYQLCCTADEICWDIDKAISNFAKHGVSFEEAATVFSDPLYVDFFDPEHSDEENRYIRVGCSNQNRILVIAYTERNNQIRIISARPATKHERHAYEKD